MTEELDASPRNIYYPLQVQLKSYPYVLSYVSINGEGLKMKSFTVAAHACKKLHRSDCITEPEIYVFNWLRECCTKDDV